MVVAAPLQHETLGVAQAGVDDELGENNFDLAFVEAVTLLDLRTEENRTVLSEQLHREEKGKTSAEHGVQDPRRRRVRPTGQERTHHNVGVDDRERAIYRLRCAFVSAFANLSAAASLSREC